MGRFKLKPKSEPGLKLCPKCLQPRLKQTLNVSGWASTPMYTCENCNYTGGFFVEVNPEEVPEEILLDLMKRRRESPDLKGLREDIDMGEEEEKNED